MSLHKLNRTLEEILDLLRQQNLQQKELLTFDEASQYLGFKPSYLYKMTASGELKSYCPTGQKLIKLRNDSIIIPRVKTYGSCTLF